MAPLYNNLKRLAARIKGDLHTDDIRCRLLATDGSIFEKPPIAVAYPRCAEDVQEIVRFAAGNGLSVHARGAGSGLCGASLGGGIVVDFTKHMHRLLRLDTDQEWFECEPGYRLGELEKALQGSGLFFPPDPSSGEYATFGGMSATNASGAHSVKYGNVADYLVDGDLVFADGALRSLADIAATPLARLPEALQHLFHMVVANSIDIDKAYPAVPCNVAGYQLRGLVQNDKLHLHRLVAGSEGTLGVLTRLRFRLIRRPAHDALVVAYCDDILQAARATQRAMALKPAGIEIMDRSLLALARQNDDVLAELIPSDVDNVLLMEFDGKTLDDCRNAAEQIQKDLVQEGLSRNVHLALSEEEKTRFWAVRKAAVPILYRLKGRRKILALVEDAAVPVDQLVPFFQGMQAIFKQHDVPYVLYGHIAKGLLHTRPLLDLKDPKDVALLRVLADAVFDLVFGLAGTVSGEHGDGRLRSAYVRRRYPTIYPLMVRTKTLLDPGTVLNPGIIIQNDADQMQHDLRYPSGYANRSLGPWQLSWPSSLATAAELCHGCSKCTTVTDETRMCPVYKVTRDEAATPKAKANVLRALIGGTLESRTLFQSRLQQVMDQCVNCGSCYRECPSNVNIPKLAMEAKAQYVRRFGAPWPHRLVAEVEWAARRLHRLMPLGEPLLRRPQVHQWVSRTTGLAPQREMVTFAKRSLYQRVPEIAPGQGPRVLYFAGCYAAFIRPELGQAAIAVMQRMGMQVHLPSQYCCGLPHLSKGMAGKARRKVRQNLSLWGQSLADVDYVAVTCSSCGYALIQDWNYLVSSDTVRRLANKVIHISQLVLDRGQGLHFGPLPLKLAYHQPCHLKIQPQHQSSRTLLEQLPGAELQDLGSHCCGMAGSWGMLSQNYALSQAIGTSLAVNLHGSDAEYGVTDCPTCQMQMEHIDLRPMRHPIEMVWQSLTSAV